ncbi:hypothetical protein D3C83_164580 [compost metagenome]
MKLGTLRVRQRARQSRLPSAQRDVRVLLLGRVAGAETRLCEMRRRTGRTDSANPFSIVCVRSLLWSVLR